MIRFGFSAQRPRSSPAERQIVTPTAELSKQFASPVHCVRVSNDGLVYVCDRANDRIQVFRKDGTFVKEFRVEPSTLSNVIDSALAGVAPDMPEAEPSAELVPAASPSRAGSGFGRGRSSRLETGRAIGGAASIALVHQILSV